MSKLNKYGPRISRSKVWVKVNPPYENRHDRRARAAVDRRAHQKNRRADL